MPDLLCPEIIRSAGAIIAKYAGGPIKRTGAGTFEGHIIRWHDPNRKDLTGEWFSQKTYLMRSAGYPIVSIPINYQHGMQKTFGNLAIGLVTFTDEDEIGQFIRGELKTRDDYIAMLHEIGRKGDVKFTDAQLARKSELAIKAVNTLVAEVPLQFSGGFDPLTWLVDPDSKHIDQAGAIHAAFTPTPADDMNPQIAFKSAWDEVLKHESTTTHSIPNPQIQTDDPTARKGGTTGDGQSDRKGDNDPAAVEPIVKVAPQGVLKMDPEMIAAIARAVAQEVLAGVAQMLNKEGQPVEVLPPEAEIVSSLTKEAIDPNLKPEDLAKALSEKAYKLVMAAVEARRKGADAAKAIANEYLKRSLPAIDTLPAGGNGNGFGHTKATNVQVYSKFQKWTAEDHSFAVALYQMSGGHKNLAMVKDPAFGRDMADKAIKSFTSGTLYLSESTFKSLNAIKANELDYSTQAGYGDEAVPTLWADTIWEKPRLDNVIPNIFESINMPSNPYEYDVESSDPTVYFVGETTGEAQMTLADSNSPIPDSKIGTGKVTFNAKKHGLRVMWSEELREDSIAALIPKFRAQAERAIADQGIDAPAIIGDTATSGNINLDGGTPGATANYMAYNGLIKQALVTASTNKLDAGGAAPSLTLLRAARGLLGPAEGFNPKNLAWIMDFQTYVKLLNDDTIVTIDKYGPAATVLTGELGRIDGIPVFVSAQMGLADSDGKITSGGNVVARGRAILAHRPSWYFAYRRKITQKLNMTDWADAWVLTITVRTDFKPRTALDGTLSSSDDTVAVIYNMGV